MRLRCMAANGVWLLSAARDAAAFRADLKRVGEVQEKILLGTLRRNGLGHIGSIREFREQIPIATYDRHDFARGLREPVERHELTSGSTGAVKRIPYTRSLRREMSRAIAPWIVSMAMRDPRAFAGEAYWSVSPGAESDEEVLGPLQRRLVRAVQAVPRSVRLSHDVDAFRRETFEQLRRCRTLSLISVWHPTFLDLLVEDHIDTREVWPHLRVISCWADANAAAGAERLARKFPHARIEPKGLLSTEAFVSVPFEGTNTLAYRSHFFEFRDGEDALLSTELAVGRRYGVVVTTGGGLYRYDTEDIVEVTGYRESCPLLRFVGRANHVSDHRGEKLNEVYVRECVERSFAAIDYSFAMLAFEDGGYVLFIDSDASDDALRIATDLLEGELREAFHYDHCRRLGQLTPLRFLRVEAGAATYLRVKSERQKLGDIKIPALDRESGWAVRFAPRA